MSDHEDLETGAIVLREAIEMQKLRSIDDDAGPAPPHTLLAWVLQRLDNFIDEPFRGEDGSAAEKARVAKDGITAWGRTATTALFYLVVFFVGLAAVRASASLAFGIEGIPPAALRNVRHLASAHKLLSTSAGVVIIALGVGARVIARTIRSRRKALRLDALQTD